MTDTRTALLDAAQRSFAEKGYGGTSIRALAAEVGIKESSVYHHVTSKEALLEAVLDRAEERMAAVAARMGVPQEDAGPAADVYAGIDPGRLEEVTLAFADAWLHHPDVVGARRALALEQFRTPDAGRRLREWTVDRPLAFQSELFAELMRRGAFREADPGAVALAFWGPLMTALAAVDAGGDEAQALARVRTHLAHFAATHVAAPGGAR